jgi:hypothetical protein
MQEPHHSQKGHNGAFLVLDGSEIYEDVLTMSHRPLRFRVWSCCWVLALTQRLVEGSPSCPRRSQASFLNRRQDRVRQVPRNPTHYQKPSPRSPATCGIRRDSSFGTLLNSVAGQPNLWPKPNQFCDFLSCTPQDFIQSSSFLFLSFFSSR